MWVNREKYLVDIKETCFSFGFMRNLKFSNGKTEKFCFVNFNIRNKYF